jgi:flavin-dependent dehydrogenase
MKNLSTVDVLVIGAGPAGSLAARQTALLGRSVLLVDKSPFPRDKVCGCCINHRALAILASVNLDQLAPLPSAPRLTEFHVHSPHRSASINLPPGLALTRAAFDHALVNAAVDQGITFAPATAASILSLDEDACRVALRTQGNAHHLLARAVVVADGLSGSSLRHLPQFAPRLRSHARVGLAAIAPPLPDLCPPHTIEMILHPAGYVGLVQLQDQRINIAAALDPAFLKHSGGPAPAVTALLRQAHRPTVPLHKLTWRGTPALTRHRPRLADRRLFVIGDAASYVEPITGEGIAWALTTGHAVADLAAQASLQWRDHLAHQWTARYRHLIRRRQHICRAVAFLLRHPTLTDCALAILAARPRLASPIMRRLTTPSPPPTPSTQAHV